MVHVDMPAKVFTSSHMAAKGQHYIVHFSSRSGTDQTYTDAIDVNVLPTPVDTALMYGKTNGQWGWSKTDHCQFTKAKSVVSPIRNATTDVLACHHAECPGAVAALGTAFSEEHARLLQKWVDEVVLLLDGDGAGRKAARAATEKLLRVGVKVSLASLPQGEEPDQTSGHGARN